MKFGVREICDVVFRAKSTMTVGNKKFFKHEPVIYFDSLKTSTLEGTVTTVYAQGGRGNARLVGWDGEKTVTFTMEDALISPLGMQILAGAGLLQGTEKETIKVHTTYQGAFTQDKTTKAVTIKVPGLPYTATEESGDTAHYIYMMPINDKGEIMTEPYCVDITVDSTPEVKNGKKYYAITLSNTDNKNNLKHFEKAESVLVDYYVEHGTSATQINITPNSLGGNFYVEASTLFRNQDGVDMPAEFIIPNAKVQSNFTFTMASSGDPSTFTFTLDAFPDNTRFAVGDTNEKVFAAIQIIDDTAADSSSNTREATEHNYGVTTSNPGSSTPSGGVTPENGSGTKSESDKGSGTESESGEGDGN